MKFESKNSLLILTATEGMLIERKGLEFPNRSFARQVYLGKYDSVENYIDIDEAEANDIVKEQIAYQEEEMEKMFKERQNVTE